jgi:APA family basic amino acid/polyamine antiporter
MGEAVSRVTRAGASPQARPVTTPEIGLVTAVALVLGNMIGSGVFLLPASLAPYGGLGFVGWTISAGGSIALALMFARLARVSADAGGFYAYTRRAFGDLPAFLVAWSYWISIWSTNAALAVAFVGYLDPFAPSLVRNPVRAAFLAVAVVWLLVYVNCRGIRDAGRMQVLTTAVKVVPLVVVGAAGLAWASPERFVVPATAGDPLAGVMATVTLTLFAFLGLESATVPAASIRDPRRTIPRATVIGTLIASALYMLCTAGVMSVIEPAALAQSSAPFADAARTLFGPAVAGAVALGAAISCFGALNGWTLMVGQLPAVAAADGLFPAVFARVSRRGVPVAGMAIGGGLATLLILSNSSANLVALYTFTIVLSTLGSLVPYLACALAATLRRPGTVSAAVPATPTASVIAMLALGYSVLAVVGAGAEALALGLLLFLAGLPIFYWSRRQRLAPSMHV